MIDCMPFEKKQFILLVLSAMAVAAFVYFRYLPLKEKVVMLNRQIDPEEAAVIRSRQQKKHIPLLQKQMNQMDEKLKDYDSLVPESKDLGDFITEITELMNAADLKYQQVSPEDAVDITDSDEVVLDGRLVSARPFDMSCSGDLFDVFEFYKALNGMNRLIRIESISLDASRRSEGDVNMKAKAVVYFRQNKQEK